MVLRRHRAFTLLITAAVVFAACTADAGDPTATSESAPAGITTGEPDETGSQRAEEVAAVAEPEAPVGAPVRHPASARTVYFVMPDRFENGDPSNDRGGLDSDDPLVTGFLPTDKGFHHGGDLAGLIDRLDYLDGLGVDALWITPPFTNRFVQGNGTIDGSSSSYHGYWQIDWDRIDPHLGTDQEMRAFVDAAHERDMLVFFDVVVNHTGDVISFAEDSYVYRSTSAAPYLTAEGEEFVPADVAGSADFPELDPAVSFAYTPMFASPDLAAAKSPAWLNDVKLYHNRGNSTFAGESVLDGDFFGLDDLFTEHPRVVQGMTDLHASLVERFGIDGFRIDTVKHVNIEFWEHFAPGVLAAAEAAGRPDFFMFGEVAGTDPILASSFTNVGLSSTLDFGVADGLDRYVAGGGTGELLAQAFDDDDWYTDVDNNASMQVTFFGNHDAGRMGYQVARANPSASDEVLLDRMRLGFDLMFTVRGVPVVYYGDEQGFTGSGGDQLARQPMFPALAPEYLDDRNIGTEATPADDNFDANHPLYTHIAALDAFREAHPVFATGAMILHETPGPTFAFSRIDRDERFEYVVVTNSNASLSVPARFRVLSPDTTFRGIRGPVDSVVTDATGEMLVEVPPLATVVLRAEQPLALASAAPTIELIRPTDGDVIRTVRHRFEAEIGDRRYAEVSFSIAIDGGEPALIGVDDAPPYRVYWPTLGVADGATVEVIATVADGSGRYASDRATITLGERP